MTTLPPPPTIGADGTIETDVVIVGAGLAGLYAALELPDGTSVVVVDKGTPGNSGSSPWAQGGMAVALGPDDSPALHLADTLRAGDGLCDPAAVHVLATEAPARVAHLLQLGTRFDRIPGREDSLDPADLHLAREGGQTVSRSVHTADATGASTACAPDAWSREAGYMLGVVLSATDPVAVVALLKELGLSGDCTPHQLIEC